MRKIIISLLTATLAATLLAGSMDLIPPSVASVKQMNITWEKSSYWENSFQLQADGTYKANVQISTRNNQNEEMQGYLATTKTSAVFHIQAQVDLFDWISAQTNQPTKELAEREVMIKWRERVEAE